MDQAPDELADDLLARAPEHPAAGPVDVGVPAVDVGDEDPLRGLLEELAVVGVAGPQLRLDALARDVVGIESGGGQADDDAPLDEREERQQRRHDRLAVEAEAPPGDDQQRQREEGEQAEQEVARGGAPRVAGGHERDRAHLGASGQDAGVEHQQRHRGVQPHASRGVQRGGSVELRNVEGVAEQRHGRDRPRDEGQDLRRARAAALAPIERQQRRAGEEHGSGGLRRRTAEVPAVGGLAGTHQQLVEADVQPCDVLEQRQAREGERDGRADPRDDDGPGRGSEGRREDEPDAAEHEHDRRIGRQHRPAREHRRQGRDAAPPADDRGQTHQHHERAHERGRAAQGGPPLGRVARGVGRRGHGVVGAHGRWAHRTCSKSQVAPRQRRPCPTWSTPRAFENSRLRAWIPGRPPSASRRSP